MLESAGTAGGKENRDVTNEEMAERLVRVEQCCESNAQRLNTVEKNQKVLNSIATSVAVMAEQQKNISDKVNTIDDKVSTMEGKSAKRWDSLVDKLIYAAAGAVLAWIAAGAPGAN